jgi:hypothetical protein
MPLHNDIARAILRNGRRVDVARFAAQVAPAIDLGQTAQAFNTTVILTSAKDGARLGRTDSALADMTPVARAQAVYLCGSHFRDDTLYLEMFFKVSAADVPTDVVRVEVLGLSAVPSSDSVVDGLWVVPNNQVIVQNATATDVVAKLKGPTAAGARIPPGATEVLPALEGNYHIEYQLHSDPPRYLSQPSFRLTGTQAREVVRIADAQKDNAISEREFFRLPTCPPAAVVPR